MAGAVAAPAAGAAAATAAATAATSVAKSIFGAVWENKTVSAIALAAAAYGLHYFTSNARGESRFGNMVGDKASDLFNWLSTDGKDGFMKFGEKGIDFVWDRLGFF